MTFTEMFPIIGTKHMPAALAFYRDLLGGTVTYQFPPDGEPGYVAIEIGGSHLGIGASDEQGRAMTGEQPADFRWISLWVYADDCDAAVERLRTAGVRIVDEPADQPWGERMARVEDPDGNWVYVANRS